MRVTHLPCVCYLLALKRQMCDEQLVVCTGCVRGEYNISTTAYLPTYCPTHLPQGLRAEVYSLQREVLQDRTKVKALSEELENPNNEHRCRPLPLSTAYL